MQRAAWVAAIGLILFTLPTWGDLTTGAVRLAEITQKAGIDFVQVSGDPVKKNLIIEAKGGGLALLDAD